MPETEIIQVKIFAPFKIYFSGSALSFSANNDTGPFDILGRHKNFMSLLRPGMIRVRQPSKPDFSMKIARGVMHVKANKVTVFLDI